VGDASIYRLTYPEIARLYLGWRALHGQDGGQQAQSMNQIAQVDSSAAAKARAAQANPHRGKARQVRESDLRTAKQFAQSAQRAQNAQ